MKTAVTHSCGHTTPVTLFGPGAERDRKLRWLASRPCANCLTEITLDRASDQSVARDLPPLTGSDKQIEWATRCRYHSLLVLDRVLSEVDLKPSTIPLPDDLRLPGESDPSLGTLIAKLYEEDRARFWIDHGKDAWAVNRRIIRDGVESNPGPTEVVAGLLLAAAGVTDAPDKHLHWVRAILRPGGSVLRKRAHPASLNAHIDAALKTIKTALSAKTRPYVAVSSGKDSAAVAHLVLSLCPTATLHWSDDELEYPETVAIMEQMQTDYGDQCIVTLGWAQHAGWFTPWTDIPFWRDPLPGTLTAGMDSDDWMARRGHDVTFLGTRADESKVRRQWLETNGPLYRVKRGTGLRCCPIWDWPTDYVYQYLEREGIPLNPVYARLQKIGVELERRRIGPLPLVPREYLVNVWPELLWRLEDRYGPRWE